MNEATRTIVTESENHFIHNVLNNILKTYSHLKPEKESTYDLSALQGLAINSIQKVGVVPLPRADNFFFPQEMYLNLPEQGLVPLDYLHMFMVSIPISHCFKGYLYTHTKLANINVSYEKANVFVGATKAIREVIHEDKNIMVPRHLCYMYYTNFFDTISRYELEPNIIDSVKFDLWLHFPVHSDVEKKYVNSIKHKLKYPDHSGSLVIKVSCMYDLTYEEVII